MPFFKVIANLKNHKLSRVDYDFLNVFTGTMDNLWLWGQTRTSEVSGSQSTSSPSQTSYYASHKFSKIYNQWDGSGTSMGIKSDGTLWGWGNNDYGQLGTNNTTNYTSPVQIGARNDWVKVAPGNNGYTHLLASDGTIWGTGYNFTWRMLGDGTYTNRSSPVLIGSGFSDIMNGYSHSIACKTDGTLWAWGYGLVGAIGDNVQYYWDSNAVPSFPAPYASPAGPVQIGSGGFNRAWANEGASGAAKSDGYLYGWATGFGRYGDTGPGLAPTYAGGIPTLVGSAITTHGTGWSNCNFIQGSANQGVYAIIKSDGTLWMYGGGNYGAYGNGDVSGSASPKQVGTNTNWFSAAVIGYSVFATTTDRKMFSWGQNNASQILALGDTNHRSSPTQIGTRRRWGLLAGVSGAGGHNASQTMVYVLAAAT